MIAVWAQLELYQGESMNMFDQAFAGEGFEPIHREPFEYSLHGLFPCGKDEFESII
jgi:hypothetical protein